MALQKENDLGTISLSGSIFSGIIFESMEQESVKGNIWPATRVIKQQPLLSRYYDKDLNLSYNIDFDENGQVAVEFGVITRFGVSIRKVTRLVADYIAERIEDIIGQKPESVTINIVGVRSKHTARRNTKAVYHYAAHG